MHAAPRGWTAGLMGVLVEKSTQTVGTSAYSGPLRPGRGRPSAVPREENGRGYCYGAKFQRQRKGAAFFFCEMNNKETPIEFSEMELWFDRVRTKKCILWSKCTILIEFVGGR